MTKYITSEQAVNIENQAKGGIFKSKVFYHVVWAVFGLFGAHRVLLGKSMVRSQILLWSGLAILYGAWITNAEFLTIVGSLVLFLTALLFIFDGISLENWIDQERSALRKKLYDRHFQQ